MSLSTDPTLWPVASVEAVRDHFPALKRRHHDIPVAYFDGPGGTQVPLRVAEAMTNYLLTTTRTPIGSTRRASRPTPRSWPRARPSPTSWADGRPRSPSAPT